MTARIYASFGAYGRPSDDERAVLALADEFRAKLAALYQDRHRATVDYRDARYPALWAAMVEHERLYHVVAEVEKRIKAHHSEVRDRNAVPPELAEKLREVREQRKQCAATLKTERAAWSAHLKAFGAWWKSAADWKNVKSLDARRAAYAALEPPEELADYCRLHVDLDLRERELYREFQAAGLHSAIRAEIVEATQPKFKKDGPGMRYFYGRKPEPRPWRKLTLQFVGGAKWSEVLAGEVPGLAATQIYTNHPSGGEESVVEISQQIGTADHPRRITYRMKLDKPLPEDAVLRRWTLAVDERGKRIVLPLLADVPSKPEGGGSFGYRLRWSVVPGGVLIAEFRGDHVCEDLILPKWLVEKRMSRAEAQIYADNRANDVLERVGVNRSKRPGALHGVAALEQWCAEHPEATREGNELDVLRRELARADKASKSAAACIEDIYRSTAAKVCRLHATVHHPEIDLAKIKRYDTRDLLRDDVLPPESRTILHAVAPGKLRAAIEGYGLARAEVPPELPGDARNTDLFTSYVAKLGTKTGRKESAPCRRSQSAAVAVGG